MADLAITGLVFPLPDPQNAVAPTGRRWSKGWRSADPPWPCPVWLSRQAGSGASTESHGGSDRLGACDRAWDRLSRRYQVGAVVSGDRRSGAMATCEVCGADYDKAFQVTVAGATHTFDSV
jgi:hypothetical protein